MAPGNAQADPEAGSLDAAPEQTGTAPLETRSDAPDADSGKAQPEQDVPRRLPKIFYGKHGKLFRQIFRFSVVGGTAFLIDYGFLYFFTEFCGINYLISSALSFTISVIYNYILSINWVFDVGENHSKSQDFVVFIILSVIGLGINQLMMWLLVELAAMWYMLAKIFATAVVMVYNFVTRKIFLER